MAYFNCFLAGSWMFVIGWYLGAIYMQNRNQEKPVSLPAEAPESYVEREGWQVPAPASVAAD
jgi:hypothetical protein